LRRLNHALPSHALLSLSLVLTAAACGDDSTPPPGRDAGGRDAGGDEMDAGDGMDAGGGLDGGGEEMDGGGEVDAGTDSGFSIPDVGPLDAGSIESCFDDAGVYDLCLCDVFECEDSSECGDGTACLPDGCGRNTCQLGGLPCGAPGDCAEGSECFTGTIPPVCRKADGGCNDSRDCPAGHSCDEGSCVNRRVPCDPESPACPFGYFCNELDQQVAQPYCQRVYRACETFDACPPFFSCVDVDGDGESECRANGGDCDTFMDCPGEVCGTTPESAGACQAQGPCAGEMISCPSGFECADVYGDGLVECVPTAGDCDVVQDCTPPGICGSLTEDGAMTCVSDAT